MTKDEYLVQTLGAAQLTLIYKQAEIDALKAKLTQAEQKLVELQTKKD